MKEKLGRRIAEEAAGAGFVSLTDFHARVGASNTDMTALAEVGALASLGGSRRQALWQVEALGRSGALFTPRAAGRRRR